jgi:hypothetical protein
MADKDPPKDVTDELDHEVSLDTMFFNQRKAVRYRRNDIKAVIKVDSALFPRLIHVALLDISSKGAAVYAEKKLKNKTKVRLYLLFSDGKRFEIDSQIVHTEATPRYGLKFNTNNPDLAEYLLHTQTELLFS